MLRVYTVFRAASTKPVEAIEAIIAFVMMVIGLYIASPWYQISPGATVGQAFQESMWQHAAVGLLFFVIPALPILLALFFKKFNTKKWRARGTFAMFIGLVFISLLTLIVSGWTPLTWLISLGMGIIAGICYLYVKQGP